MLQINEYYVLLDMMRYGIDFEKYYEVKDYSGVDWEKVFELSKLHRISVISFHGLDLLMNQSQIVLNDDLRGKWLKNIEQQRVIDMSQRIAYDEISNKFEEQMINYYPFKGFSLKALYEKPYYREMTDIDFFVNEADFTNTEKIMLRSGYVKEKESNNAVLTMRKGPFVKVEFQNTFFDKQYYSNLGKYFETELPVKSNNSEYKLYWDETAVYIYLFCHLIKHLKNGGAGLRLFLDLWLYEEKYRLKIKWENAENILEKLEIGDEYISIREIITEWFKNNSYSQNSELENYILTSGIFGTLDHLIVNKINKEMNTTI